MKMLEMCLNPKVLAGLAVAGVGVWWLAPHLFTAVLPLLLIAACPLSMVAMMLAMRGGGGHGFAPAATATPDE